LKTHGLLSARFASHVPPGRAKLVTRLPPAFPENLQIREVCKPLNRQVLEKLHECPGNTNVMKITEALGGLAAGWNP
jgi:hypothetical protein